MVNISFTANLIRRTQIPKRVDDNTYIPADVAIVELDKHNKNDVKSLYGASVLWNDQGAKYSSNIYHEAVKGYEYDNIEYEHYFALTEQKDNFDELDSEKILGLMMFSNTNDPEDEISWLQVRPNTNTNQSWKREYKGVGKALVDLVKQVNYFRPIHVLSSNEAVEFYKKQGFVNHDDDIPASLYLDV